MLSTLYRFRRVLKLSIARVCGNDLTCGGERVDIDFTKKITFETLDMYQQSHFRRYEFAQSSLGPEMLIGDFASGTGYGTVMLASVARKVYGCDIDARTIDAVKKRYEHHANATFSCKDLLTLKPNDFPPLDLITSFETIEHLPESSIANLFFVFNSLLTCGGTLLFSVPFMQPDTPASRRHHGTFLIDEAKIRSWTNQAGFTLSEIFYQNYQTHSISDELPNKDFIICRCSKNAHPI